MSVYDIADVCRKGGRPPTLCGHVLIFFSVSLYLNDEDKASLPRSAPCVQPRDGNTPRVEVSSLQILVYTLTTTALHSRQLFNILVQNQF